jgi:carbonic anhydrase
MAQSPVDIQQVKETAQSTPIHFQYRGSTASIVNNGHTVEVRPAAGGGMTTPAGTFELVQFHFHAPGEYTIDGKQYPLTAHLVHRSEKGQLAVIGIKFEVGAANKALAPVFGALPDHGAAPAALPGKLDVTGLLPKQRGYYALTGSLTTPPCSEGVQWYVLRQPATVSSAQLAAFRKLYPMNARPVQPRNDRVISSGQ